MVPSRRSPLPQLLQSAPSETAPCRSAERDRNRSPGPLRPDSLRTLLPNSLLSFARWLLYSQLLLVTLALTATGCQNIETTATTSPPVAVASSALAVPVGPNTAGTTTATASFGGSSIETLAYGNPYRVRTSGTITGLQFNFHTGSAATHLYVRFWTQTASNVNSFNLNCATEDLLLDSLASGLNTVTLQKPCAVTAGDFWSVYIVDNATTTTSPLDTIRDQYTFSFTDTSGFGAAGATGHVFAASAASGAPIPAILNLYQDVYPTLAVAGDSQMDGWNGIGTGMADFWEKYLNDNSSFPNYLSTVIANQMPNYVAQARGWTLADYSEAGSTSARIASVFTSIVVPLHPQVALVGFTSNDTIEGLFNPTVYLANYTAIASAAQSAGIKLVLTSTPAIGYDAALTASQLDVANSYGPALCAAYGCLWVDTRPTVDLFRPGAYAGNLWNINILYYFQDDLHLNALGQQTVANLVLNALSSFSPGGQTSTLASTPAVHSSRPVLSYPR
jgi:lysophospholipase L1-like esterase